MPSSGDLRWRRGGCSGRDNATPASGRERAVRELAAASPDCARAAPCSSLRGVPRTWLAVRGRLPGRDRNTFQLSCCLARAAVRNEAPPIAVELPDHIKTRDAAVKPHRLETYDQ